MGPGWGLSAGVQFRTEGWEAGVGLCWPSFPVSSLSLLHFLRLKVNIYIYLNSLVQHGIQLVGQVVKHVADVIQDGPCRLHCVWFTKKKIWQRVKMIDTLLWAHRGQDIMVLSDPPVFKISSQQQSNPSDNIQDRLVATNGLDTNNVFICTCYSLNITSPPLPLRCLLLVQFPLNSLQSCCERRAGLSQSLLNHLSPAGWLGDRAPTNRTHLRPRWCQTGTLRGWSWNWSWSHMNRRGWSSKGQALAPTDGHRRGGASSCRRDNQ